MFSVSRLCCELQWDNYILEDLFVSHDPVSKCHHKDWSILCPSKGCVIEFLVIHWWLFVVVCKQKLLNYIVVEEGGEFFSLQSYKNGR